MSKTIKRFMVKALMRFFCKIGWHSFSYDLVEYDDYHGTANKYKCKWCGYVGMKDSHGNLF